MKRIMCKSKIRGLVVTKKRLDYEGSIELPAEVLKAADILPGEFVLVINENNGARFETYTIIGKPGCCGLLGGAARLGEIGDRLIVLSQAIVETEKAEKFKMRIVKTNKNKL